MSDKSNTPTAEWRSNANKRRTRGLICTELLELFEIYDDMTVAAHLVNILRSKGRVVGFNTDGTPKYRDPYHIKDEELLKDLESYKASLIDKVMDPE